jgi:uncharacterized membrane protein
MKKTRILTFTAIMAALANVMSLPPLAIPIYLGNFTSAIHFFQLAVFTCGILAGPWAGFLCGAAGGLYMSMMKIPFVLGGIAILGGSAGLYAKKVRPILAGLLAWTTQAPYVLVTDYMWFAFILGYSSTVAWAIITPIMMNLTLQAIICSILAEIIVHYVKKSGLILQ